MSTIMEKEIFEQADKLRICLKNNEKTLDRLAKIILEQKPVGILLAARGSSDNAGTYFKYALETLSGIPVCLAAPSVCTLYGKKLNLEKYIVIGVSQSGAAEDVMAVLECAKENKALTISITNDTQSKMANMTDYHLFCSCEEEKSVAATKTFTAELYLLSQLAARVGKKAELISQLAALPADIEKILGLKEEIKALAQKYKGISTAIVLARGLNYAIAQETSLKLQETCYINARPYPASDFVHGPFALVDNTTNLILLAPSGESFSDMMNLKARLIAAGGNVLVYSDDKKAAEGCKDSIILPLKCNDYMSPFYNVVVSQMFACYLSTARGLNPDAPRGLKKVTITK